MVNGTSNTNGASNSVPQQTSGSNTLGQDAFLKLLVTQLKSQDPLKPMEDKEFISQLAQFSSLEQMQQVNQSLGLLAQMNAVSQASSMIGKQITVEPLGEDSFTGKVSAVIFEENQPWLMIGETKVNPADVIRVEP